MADWNLSTHADDLSEYSDTADLDRALLMDGELTVVGSGGLEKFGKDPSRFVTQVTINDQVLICSGSVESMVRALDGSRWTATLRVDAVDG